MKPSDRLISVGISRSIERPRTEMLSGIGQRLEANTDRIASCTSQTIQDSSAMIVSHVNTSIEPSRHAISSELGQRLEAMHVGIISAVSDTIREDVSAFGRRLLQHQQPPRSNDSVREHSLSSRASYIPPNIGYSLRILLCKQQCGCRRHSVSTYSS